MNKKLPKLDTEYKITQDQVLQFQRDGHLLLRNVCSKKEIEAYRHYIGAVVQEHAKTQKDLSKRDTYGKAFLQIGNIWTQDDVVKRLVFARRFARIAAQLSISPSVRLYHDQALYKEGHGGITPWHQDQFYWPLDTNQSITMWMPMVDVSQEMGPIGFASGSHKNGYLGDILISDESEEYFKEYIKTKFSFSTILLTRKNFAVQLHDQQEIRCIGVLYLKILKTQVFVVPNLQELLDRHFHVNSKNLN